MSGINNNEIKPISEKQETATEIFRKQSKESILILTKSLEKVCNLVKQWGNNNQEFQDYVDNLNKNNIDTSQNNEKNTLERGKETKNLEYTKRLKLEYLDKSKLIALICFTLNTLCFVSLKLDAVPTKSHDIKKELQRTRKQLENIDQIISKVEGRRLVVDKGAAARFVKSAIPKNQKFSKADLQDSNLSPDGRKRTLENENEKERKVKGKHTRFAE